MGGEAGKEQVAIVASDLDAPGATDYTSRSDEDQS